MLFTGDTTMKKLRTWHEFLIEQLADREEAVSYLQVSLEEYLMDGDLPFFLKGIRNVVEAQGGIAKIAKQADIAPKVVSEFLCNEDTLALGTLSTILKGFGWKLSIEPLMETDTHSSEVTNEQSATSNALLETSTEQTAESQPS